MSWVRCGDTFATYPALLKVAGDAEADVRSVNEVAGFLMRASALSAAHLTDYMIDSGTLMMLGHGRGQELINLCLRAGLMFEEEVDGQTMFRIVADPDFIHVRLKSEVDWERQRRNDTRNPSLTVPIRFRDGDNCRWCGVMVQWRGKKSNRSAELDHLVPGEAATVETLVVACLACNRGRSGNREAWDTSHVLRTAPVAPVYGATTAKFLSDNGYLVVAVASDETSESPEVPQPVASSGSSGDGSRVPLASAAVDVVRVGGEPSSGSSDDDGSRVPLASAAVGVVRVGGEPSPPKPLKPDKPLPKVCESGLKEAPNSHPNSIRRSDRISSVGSGREKYLTTSPSTSRALENLKRRKRR